MAALCPQCGAELGKDTNLDFGMATCPSCQAVVFIDIEGNAHAQAAGEDHSAGVSDHGGQSDNFSSHPDAFPMVDDQQFSTQSTHQQNIEAQSELETDFVPPQIEPPPEFEAQNQEQAVDFAHQGESPEGTGLASEEYHELNMDAGQSALASTASAEQIRGNENHFDAGASADSGQGLSEFANADVQKGSLSYNLIISGIDTFEIRKQLKDALSASQFQWDVDALLAQIVDGVLEIKQINPVKASRAVEAVKDLSITVRWTQHIY